MKNDDQLNKLTEINDGVSHRLPNLRLIHTKDFYIQKNIPKNEYEDLLSWAEKNLAYRLISVERSYQNINPVLRDYILSKRILNTGSTKQNSSDKSPILPIKNKQSDISYYSYHYQAIVNLVMSESKMKNNRRIGYYCPGYSQNSVLSVPWDSIMIDSNRFVLQRWRGVCSFSQSNCCYWSEYGSKYFLKPHPKRQSRKVWSCSDQTKKFKVIKINIIHNI